MSGRVRHDMSLYWCDMTVIDMHVHAFPDDLAERAISTLEKAADWRAIGGGRVADLIESMDAAGVDKSVVCTIATRPEQMEGILRWCEAISGERIVAFPSVHPQADNPAGWVERIAEAGFAGIKLHPMYQDFAADDEMMDPLYAAASDCDLLLELHSGCDIAFVADRRASPQRLARVVRKHPKLKLICTHLGGWMSWNDVRKHLVGSGVYLETSFSIEWLGPQGCEEIIRAHGAERILFGTDWPWADQARQIAMFEATALSDEQKHRIFRGNAAELLGH